MVQHGIKELSYYETTGATIQLNEYSLKLVTNKESFMFEQGETIEFLMVVKKNETPVTDLVVNFEIIWDQISTIHSGEIPLNEKGQALVKYSSDKIGFLHIKCFVDLKNGQKLEHRVGVGIKPGSIEPPLPLPDDFNQFWQKQKKLLSAVPVDSEWTLINHKSHPNLHNYSHADLLKVNIDNVEINEVSVKCLEKNVRGIYTRPKTRKPKGHPAMLCVQGAGVMPTRPHNFIMEAENGILVYEIGAHGLSNFEEESFYKNLFEKDLKGYMKFGNKNKEESYFRLMYLRVKRGLDFLMNQPEWDGERLIIRGSSQGGAQCMAGAYLEPKVKFIAASVSALCNHTGFLKGRSVGGGRLVDFDEHGQPIKETLECSRYFDGVNFLRNAQCKGSFSVGLVDGGCSPSSIYTAYNAFKGQKKMYHQPYTGHANTPEVIDKMTKDIYDYIQDKIK